MLPKWKKWKKILRTQLGARPPGPPPRDESASPEARAEGFSPEELAGRSEYSSASAHPGDRPSGEPRGGPPHRDRLDPDIDELGVRSLDEATQGEPSPQGEAGEAPPAEEDAVVPEPDEDEQRRD